MSGALAQDVLQDSSHEGGRPGLDQAHPGGYVRALGLSPVSSAATTLPNIVYPRQVAVYLSRELTDSSLPKISREFGGRDHTTVIHATSKITPMIREDRSVYNLVQGLAARIKQAH